MNLFTSHLLAANLAMSGISPSFASGNHKGGHDPDHIGKPGDSIVYIVSFFHDDNVKD